MMILLRGQLAYLGTAGLLNPELRVLLCYSKFLASAQYTSLQ